MLKHTTLTALLLIVMGAINTTPVVADSSVDAVIAIQQKEVEINGNNGKLLAYPQAICGLQNVGNLILTNHSFTEVPDCIGQHKQTLRKLDLSGNSITTLSPKLFELKFLENLDLSKNEITELPSAIGGLHNLQNLNLSDTKITSLPDSMSYLTSLKILNLANTKIAIAPKALSSFVNLKTLILTGVKTLPAAEQNVINAIFLNKGVDIKY